MHPCAQVSDMCFQSLTLNISYYNPGTTCGNNLRHTLGFVDPTSYTKSMLNWNNKPDVYTPGAAVEFPIGGLTQSN